MLCSHWMRIQPEFRSRHPSNSDSLCRIKWVAFTLHLKRIECGVNANWMCSHWMRYNDSCSYVTLMYLLLNIHNITAWVWMCNARCVSHNILRSHHCCGCEMPGVFHTTYSGRTVGVGVKCQVCFILNLVMFWQVLVDIYKNKKRKMHYFLKFLIFTLGIY